MHTSETHDMDWAERPLFRKDQQLTPERLNRIHDHQATRLRHALLGIAGPGIVYGYHIRTNNEGLCECESGKIYIGCGLAIDNYGRQLYWPGAWVGVDQLAEKPDCAGYYTLRVHFSERRTDACHQCGCPPDQADWVEEGVVFTLRKGCEKILDNCPESDGNDDQCPENTASCITAQQQYICYRSGSTEGSVPVDEHLHALCESPGALCHVACDDWLYDADAGLPLACLSIEDPKHNQTVATNADCHQWIFTQHTPKVCGYRAHVYRNSLLYELINGCHLDYARVDKLSIDSWLENSFEKPVAWEDFVKAIGEGITVHFSKPIQLTTLNQASVFVAAVVRDKDTYFQDLWRLPMDITKPAGETNIDDPNLACTQSIRLIFNDTWIKNQLKSELSRFNFGGVIELTIRGALLRDHCGNMLDGRPLGFSKQLPGHAMLGADFVAAFCVANRPAHGGKDK